MSKFNNTLDKTLGITDVVEQQLEVVTPSKPVVKTDNEDLENDYKYQRENFYQLVERGQDAVQGIIDLARESEHVTEKLGDLQLKMQKLKEVPNNAPKNVTNALFVGSTTELQKMLKNNARNKDNIN